METQRKFNVRAFASIGMLISVIGLPFSGLMNHSLGFDELTNQRHLWMSVHNILGIFFIIFSTWHIILNRKALINYLKKASNLLICREFIYAASIILFFLTLAILHTFAAAS